MRDTDDVRDAEIGAVLRQLPVPGVSDDFFLRLRAELRQLAGSATEGGVGAVTLSRGFSRWRQMGPDRARAALVAAVLTLIVAVPAGFFLGSSVSADPETEPINSITTFQPAPGWNTVTTTFGPNGEKLSVAWAATVPFVSEKDFSGFPSETIEALPSDGIVISAIGPRPYTGGESFPAIREPLDLSQGSCVWDQYEGQPAPNVSKCLIDTMVGDRLFNVIVWFGTTEPDDDMIAQANDELANLVVPGS